MEHRVSELERRVDAIEKSIFNLHNTSMAFVNEKFEQMERRLLEKIDQSTDKTHKRIDSLIASSARRQTAILVAIVGAIATIAAAAIALLSHR